VTLVMAILVGLLYAAAVYLMLRRNMVRLVFGLVILDTRRIC
jgi:multicomponent Na+:H+ antiporter subunit C